MSAVRTLHLTPSVRLLGARRSLLTLVRLLKSRGEFDPLVVVPRPGALTEELDRAGIPWTELFLPPWRKGASWVTLPARVAALRDLIGRERIGLVHCNEIYPNPHAVAACGTASLVRGLAGGLLAGHRERALRVPIVTHMRLSVTPRMVKNYGLVSATRLIAVSEGAARDFDPFPWKARKVRAILNGLELEEFEEARLQRDAIRRELGFAESDFVIGQIGLLMPRKRPRFLVEAMPRILKAVPGARAVFVGEASPGQAHVVEELKALARELGVEDKVSFYPFQREVARWFAALDLNMLVSNEEGFGRVIVEAGAAGVATVGSRVGGIPELIEDGVTGYLLGEAGRAERDEEFWRELPRFVEIVSELADDRERCRALGDAAARRARERFGAEKYVAGVEAVFREALGGPEGGE